MKYIPTILIVGLNIAIAWKMKGIKKVRQQVEKDIGNVEFQSLSAFDKRMEVSSW